MLGVTLRLTLELGETEILGVIDDVGVTLGLAVGVGVGLGSAQQASQAGTLAQ